MYLPLRPTTPSFFQRFKRCWRKLRETSDWAAFAGGNWAERIMSEEVTDRFHAKQGRTIGRWTLTAEDGRTLVVYLKRHYELPKLAGWLANLFPWRAWSPGLQEWNNLQKAASIGLPVPRAVAAGELVGPGSKLQSFLAVEELTGMLALHEAIPLASRRLAPADFNRWKWSLAQELARLSRLLHDRSYFHKDLYLCHFYIREDDCGRVPESWQDRVVVIDLHRLSRHRLLGFWYRVKDLGQLLYSSEVTGVRNGDRRVFWKAYTAGRSRGLLRRLVLLKWRRYRGHNLKRAARRPTQGGTT